MSEHPILFSGPMVRAILAGRKTQMRRPIDASSIAESPHGGMIFFSKGPHHGNMVKPKYCPYGRPGDILWVRETWQTNPVTNVIHYRATEEEYHPFFTSSWRPSIHMPRWAARLFLRVKSVRVERVRDITEADAWAEGCKKGEPWESGKGWFPALEPCFNKRGEHIFDTGWDFAKEWFQEKWDEICGADNFETVNPWVWAIEFERIENYQPEADHE